MTEITAEQIMQETSEIGDVIKRYGDNKYKQNCLVRDKIIELLEGDYSIDADPEIRLEAVKLKAEQTISQENQELYDQMMADIAAIDSFNARTSGVTAAGWADQFENSRWARKIRELDKKDAPELESGDDEPN